MGILAIDARDPIAVGYRVCALRHGRVDRGLEVHHLRVVRLVEVDTAVLADLMGDLHVQSDLNGPGRFPPRQRRGLPELVQHGEATRLRGRFAVPEDGQTELEVERLEIPADPRIAPRIDDADGLRPLGRGRKVVGGMELRRAIAGRVLERPGVAGSVRPDPRQTMGGAGRKGGAADRSGCRGTVAMRTGRGAPRAAGIMARVATVTSSAARRSLT